MPISVLPTPGGPFNEQRFLKPQGQVNSQDYFLVTDITGTHESFLQFLQRYKHEVLSFLQGGLNYNYIIQKLREKNTINECIRAKNLL